MDFFLVILSAQRAYFSLLSQLFYCHPLYFFTMAIRFLLLDLARPFPCEVIIRRMDRIMPYSKQNVDNSIELNALALSVVILDGTPKSGNDLIFNKFFHHTIGSSFGRNHLDPSCEVISCSEDPPKPIVGVIFKFTDEV
jgi:hypothetical protein